MPDQRHPDDPAYDWLYESGGDSQQPPARDADATRAIRSQPAFDDPDATQLAGRAGSLDSDATALSSPGEFPTAPRDDQSDATRMLGAPTQGQGPQPQSFGGTYVQPGQSNPATQQHADSGRPSQPGQRFATPVQTYPSVGTPPPRAPVPGASRITPPPRKRRRSWWVRGILLLFVAWLAFLLAVPVWAWSNLSKVDAEPAGDRPPETSGTTYLLVGSDSREGLTKAQEADLGTGAAAGQRTDTILLLVVPSGGGPRLLLSIPRDSFVDIPGYGQSKINAAYSIGGPELLVNTVEQATDVRIDNYVEIGFAGFVEVVDAVGGVDVCPKTSIDDPKAGDLTLPKGCQHVDGHTALSYSRSRAFPRGDITRALHQREVIGEVGASAASWKTIVLPWRYFSLNKAAAETVRVGEDVNPIDAARFGWAMAHIGGSDTKRCVVPYSDLGASTSAGSAVIWDEERANALFAGIRSGDTAGISCQPQ